MRNALLASVIYNTSGKTFKKHIDIKSFIPSYLDEDKEIDFIPKSINQQQQEFKSFINKVSMIKRQQKRKTI